MRVRKQRAETIRDLRSRMQSLDVQEEANDAATFDSTLAMNEPASPTTKSCLSPVPTSPARSTSRRTRWTPCRQDQPLQLRLRRLSETRSPMPALKVRTDADANINNKLKGPRPSVLSPLRTNAKLSMNSPNVMSPVPRPVKSPMPAAQRSPFKCLSPKMGKGNRREGNSSNEPPLIAPRKRGKLTPSKRPLATQRPLTTPVKATADQPLMVPKRVRTPPPPPNMRATRMF